MTDEKALATPAKDRTHAALLEPSNFAPQWLKNSLAVLKAPYRVIPAEHALTAETRKVVQETRSRLGAHLQPASVDDLGTGLAMLQAQFPSQDVDKVTAKVRVQGYLMALDGVPAFALDEAIKRVLQRKVPDLEPKFMPTAPQLRGLVDEISLPARWHAAQLRMLLDAKVHGAPSERASPERVAEIYAEAVLAMPTTRKRHPGDPSGVDHADKDTYWH